MDFYNESALIEWSDTNKMDVIPIMCLANEQRVVGAIANISHNAAKVIDIGDERQLRHKVLELSQNENIQQNFTSGITTSKKVKRRQKNPLGKLTTSLKMKNKHAVEIEIANMKPIVTKRVSLANKSKISTVASTIASSSCKENTATMSQCIDSLSHISNNHLSISSSNIPPSHIQNHLRASHPKPIITSVVSLPKKPLSATVTSTISSSKKNAGSYMTLSSCTHPSTLISNNNFSVSSEPIAHSNVPTVYQNSRLYTSDPKNFSSSSTSNISTDYMNNYSAPASSYITNSHVDSNNLYTPSSSYSFMNHLQAPLQPPVSLPTMVKNYDKYMLQPSYSTSLTTLNNPFETEQSTSKLIPQENPTTPKIDVVGSATDSEHEDNHETVNTTDDEDETLYTLCPIATKPG